MKLYHRTTKDAAEAIVQAGSFRSREHTGHVYFSTKIDGQADGYGNHVVVVEIEPADDELDDEFPDGEQHYRIHTSRIMAAHIIDSTEA